MARLRLSLPAQADLTRILERSAARWGTDGRRRYAALLAAAMRRVANDPATRLARDRPDLLPGLCSFHVRHARRNRESNEVKEPVHVLYYRIVEPGLVEIVRVLHEHMEPGRHIGTTTP